MTTLTVGVNELKIGMYVVQLDRPWLETPFLFQGFYIRDQDDINELKKHCDYVHILQDTAGGQSYFGMSPDPSRAEPSPSGDHESIRRRRTGLSGRRWFRMPVFLHPTEKKTTAGLSGGSYGQPGTFYEETETFEDELRNATDVHKAAVTTVHDVMNTLKASDKLDMQQLEATVTLVVNSILRNPSALSCLVRLQKKDDYLYHHSLACVVWASVFGRHLGLNREDLSILAMGALLLDIGKIRLSDSILHKPGRLSSEEMGLVRRHVTYGIDILKETKGVDQRVMDMVVSHHERYNGGGYPKGLKGSQVPVFGRIAGIVDSYDAMITFRPYAEPVSSYEAFRQLRKLADVEFQAELIDQFTHAIGLFPTGTLVELNTGEVAVVTKQNPIRRLRPEIMVIMNEDKEMLESFAVVDLNKESATEDGRHSVWIEHGLAPGSFGVDPTEFFLD